MSYVMRFVHYIILIGFVLISKFAVGAEGCRVGNTVYHNFAGYNSVSLVPLSLGTKSFYSTSPYSTVANTCPGWARINSSTSQICFYGNPTLGLSIGGFQIAVCAGCPSGIIVDYNYVLCPLDDYTFHLTATAGLFGIFFIRKRNLF